MRKTPTRTRPGRDVSDRIRTRRTRCSVAVLAAIGLLSAARAGAAPSGATLAPGTIPVLRGVVSDYANSATFSTAPVASTGGQALTINQLLPKIILNWSQFNIGTGSIVQFVQPSSTAAVLNRIYDNDPSIIQGQIKANGQVYLVNQNGILFDRGAQINVNTLFASSLNIDDAVFQKSVTTGGLFTPAFTGGYDSTGKTVSGAKTGAIVIGANGAATAAAPQLAAQSGGAIVLIAPIIDNQSGVITSPDGQVILAAGRSVYLGFNEVNDNSLRGMLVESDRGQRSDQCEQHDQERRHDLVRPRQCHARGPGNQPVGPHLGVVGHARQRLGLPAGALARRRATRHREPGVGKRDRDTTRHERHDDAA